MAEDQLKPCPFCGGQAEFVDAPGGGYRVSCKSCDAHGGWGDYGYQAEASWNGRAPSEAPAVSADHSPDAGNMVPAVSAERPGREDIERVIADADRRLAYSMDLVRLVDGDHTYQLKIDDETLIFTDSDTPEWNAQERLYAHIAEAKGRIRADAILALFAVPATPEGEENQQDSSSRNTGNPLCGEQPVINHDATAALAKSANALPSEDEITQILFSVQRGAMRLRVGAAAIMSLYEAAKPSAWRYEFSAPRQEDGWRDGSLVWHVGYGVDRPAYEVWNLTPLYERRITSV